MKRTGEAPSRRTGTAVLLAACAAALALAGCDGPGWSPDSQNVVVQLGPEEGEHGLAILDVSGRFVRWVARAEGPGTLFTEAAWSPDGRRIAYVRVEERQTERAGGDTVEYSIVTVFAQNAESGEQHVLRSTEHVLDRDSITSLIQLTPRWIGGSGTVLIGDPTESAPLLVDLDGTTRGLPMPSGDRGWGTPAPDGKLVAYVERRSPAGYSDLLVGRRRTIARPVARLMLDLPEKPPGQASSLDDLGDAFVHSAPIWSADGRFIVVQGLTNTTAGKPVGVAYRVEVRTGKVNVAWQDEAARPHNVSVSADGSVVGVSYGHRGDGGGGVAVSRPDMGERVNVFASRRSGPSLSSVSPDGRWLACSIDESMILLIGTETGALRACPVDRHPPERTLDLIRERAMASLEDMGVAEALVGARANPEAALSRDELPGFMAALDAAARDHPGPIQRQAVDYARALVCIAVARGLPADEAGEVRRDAEAHLDAFLAHEPDAELRATLGKAFYDGLAQGAAAP